jgi:hypothetical protein
MQRYSAKLVRGAQASAGVPGTDSRRASSVAGACEDGAALTTDGADAGRSGRVATGAAAGATAAVVLRPGLTAAGSRGCGGVVGAVSYTHLRAHETM